MVSPSPAGTLRDLLAFYSEAGADEPLDELPRNRLAATAAASGAPLPARTRLPEPPRPEPSPSPLRMTTISVPDGSQAALARELARSAETLDALRETMEAFDGCNLKTTAKQLVFADGNPRARIMLVGEAPGRDEDIEGRPFVGRSGQLLDRMLAAIGLDRDRVYIANVIPWRPPGNRTPTPHETEICRPFIERQVELVGPKVLLALGGPSAKLLTGSNDGILRMRGTWRQHTTAGGTGIPVMPTLHPAYLLRTPAHKKLVWRDLLEVKARLRGTDGLTAD